MTVQKTLDEERNSLDSLTDTMFAVDFLKSYTDTVFDGNYHSISISNFYNEWLKNTGAPQLKIPFNLGIFLAYLYVGILHSKENWIDLIPDIKVSEAQDWGLSHVDFSNPKEPDMPLRNFIKRLRNALGHAEVYTIIPTVEATPETIMDMMKYSFKDTNIRDHKDIFEATLSMTELNQLIKKFHEHVYPIITSKS